MSNDPAFLFYPGDYLRDTQCLSEKVQVAYDRIMCEHMRNILITPQQLKFFTKKLSDDEKEELLMTLTKIDGGYQISWVTDSIKKRKLFTESRRNSRLKSDKDNVRIYVVRDNVRSTYKIGSSVNPVRRYNELSNQKAPALMADVQNQRDLTLIWYSEPVERIEEKKLHNVFKNKHLYGEWFSLNNEDLNLIFTKHKGTTYVERTENENENVNKDINKNKTTNTKKDGFENTKNWESEKQSFLNAGDWIFKFCTDKQIPLEIFEKKAKEFISDIELREDFKPLKELRSHFTNWYNLKNKSNGKYNQQEEMSNVKIKLK